MLIIETDHLQKIFDLVFNMFATLASSQCCYSLVVPQQLDVECRYCKLELLYRINDMITHLGYK